MENLEEMDGLLESLIFQDWNMKKYKLWTTQFQALKLKLW